MRRSDREIRDMARKKEPEIKKHKAVSSSSFITSIRREEETKKKKTKRTLIITVCAILLAGLLLAGWALLSSSDYFCEHSAAVRVKNHSVSPVMFDYFYRDAYSTFCQQNLDVISLYLDTTKPLDEQWYDQQQNVTWADYFMAALTKGGLVEGASGKGGGYRLRREPSEYPLGEILRLTEGSLAPVACLEPGAAACPRAERCRTLPMMIARNCEFSARKRIYSRLTASSFSRVVPPSQRESTACCRSDQRSSI